MIYREDLHTENQEIGFEKQQGNCDWQGTGRVQESFCQRFF